MKPVFNLVVLAAGEGKRLKTKLPKVLTSLNGKKLVDFPISEYFKVLTHKKSILSGHVSVVVGHQSDKVINHLKKEYGSDQENSVSIVHQEKQLGTADAVRSYFQSMSGATESDYTIVACGDTALIRDTEYLSLIEEVLNDSSLDAVVATFKTERPFGYGRILQESEKKSIGLKIIEEKDLPEEYQDIQQVNSGLYIFRTQFLVNQISKVESSNKAQEFYLTDVFQYDLPVKAKLFSDSRKFLGINNLEELEVAQKLINQEKVRKLRENGVRFINSDSVYIDYDVEIEPFSTIYPNVIIEGPSKIGEGVIIEAGSIIKSSVIHSDCIIKGSSYLENCEIFSKAHIGPYARIRPDSFIGEEAKIGNFVEIKKSFLERDVKVSHLSYIGDAKIGEETNIGCGFITCNYDGAKKHQTTIGKKTFIGSDCQMIAPIDIGDECFIAAGSTITESMSSGSFALARQRQVTKEGMAKKFIKSKK